MKNMRVSKKLIFSFLLVAILTAVVGAFGIFGMMQINNGASEMYDLQTVPLAYMTTIVEMIQRERACMREFIVGAAVIVDPNDRNDDGILLIEDARSRAASYRETLNLNKPLYRDTIRSQEALDIFDEATRLYDTRFEECMELIYEGARNGDDPAELYALMRTYTDDINAATDNFGKY